MIDSNFPSPDDAAWPDARDKAIFEILDVSLEAFGWELFDYQRDFLEPPPPWEYEKIKLIIQGGAKRIGKSMMEAFRGSVTPLIPGYTTRLYGFQHENCEREFRHLKHLLIDPNWNRSLCHLHPQLLDHLTDFNDKPDKGRLVMEWAWGSNIRSMSWQQNTQWVGEPIDLGIICEPGLLPFAEAYSAKIKSNLMDRRGLCIAAGTVDDPSMMAFHDLAHDAEKSPDIFCVCEVPQWANTTLQDYSTPEKAARYIAQCKRDMTSRDFAINILGQWENYSNIAYELWTPRVGDYIKILSKEAWGMMKKIPANCDHFLVVDTGKHCACGEFIVNPAGSMVMIDMWTNYEYRAGKITLTDTRGFKSWFADILYGLQDIQDRNRNQPYVIIDPSSHFKLDIHDLGLGCVDAVNAHDYGANCFNEYLNKRRFVMVRPEGRPPYVAESELARVRWAESVSGIQGKHRLEKGSDDDHAADIVRYAAASRPLGGEPVTKRRETFVERDMRMAIQGRKSSATLYESMGGVGEWY